MHVSRACRKRRCRRDIYDYGLLNEVRSRAEHTNVSVRITHPDNSKPWCPVGLHTHSLHGLRPSLFPPTHLCHGWTSGRVLGPAVAHERPVQAWPGAHSAISMDA